MILHHLQRCMDAEDDGKYDDNSVSKAALLIAEHLIIETNTSDHLERYNNLFFKFNEDEYLRDLIRNSDKESIDFGVYSKAYKIFQTVKKHRTTHKVTKEISSIRKIITKNKVQFKKEYEDFLVGYKCMELYQFYTSKKLDLISITPYNESSGKEDPYIEYIKKIIGDTKNVPVLMMDRGFFPGISEWEIWKEKDNIEQLPEYLNCVLFRFPDISDLTYEQLNYTRESILKKINTFNQQMDNLHDASIEIFYEPQHWQALQCLMIEKLRGSEKLQQAVDEEIYLQQAKNSGSKKMIEVSVGITSLEAMAGYYEKTGMLEPYVAATLKERIDKSKGLNRCCIYYNFRVIEPAISVLIN